MARIHAEAPWTRRQLSPQYTHLRPGYAAIQWSCGRRGRVTIVTALMLLIVFVMVVARRSEVSTLSFGLQTAGMCWRGSCCRVVLKRLRQYLSLTRHCRRTTITSRPGDLISRISRLRSRRHCVSLPAPRYNWRMERSSTHHRGYISCHQIFTFS